MRGRGDIEDDDCDTLTEGSNDTMTFAVAVITRHTFYDSS